MCVEVDRRHTNKNKTNIYIKPDIVSEICKTLIPSFKHVKQTTHTIHIFLYLMVLKLLLLFQELFALCFFFTYEIFGYNLAMDSVIFK